MNNPMLIPVCIAFAILLIITLVIMFIPPIPVKNRLPLEMQNYGVTPQNKDDEQDFYFGLIDSVVHILQDTWNISADELKDHCDYRPTSYGTVVEIILPHYQFRFYFKWSLNTMDISMITNGENDSIITQRQSFRNFTLNYESIYLYLRGLYQTYGSQHYLDKNIVFKSMEELETQIQAAAMLVPDDKLPDLYQAYKQDAAKYGISRKELSLLLMLSKFLDKQPDVMNNDKEEVNE